MSDNPYVAPEVVAEPEPTRGLRPLAPFEKRVLQFYIAHRHKRYSATRPLVMTALAAVIGFALLIYLETFQPREYLVPFVAGALISALGNRIYLLLVARQVVPLFVGIIDYDRAERILAQEAYEGPEWTNTP